MALIDGMQRAERALRFRQPSIGSATRMAQGTFGVLPSLWRMATKRQRRSSWKPLKNAAPFDISTMLLLTDGTVMAQEAGGARWARLTPDDRGSYVRGIWSAMAPMRDGRSYYASAVLRDGRVLICGGEASTAGIMTNRCEVYDPLTDTWTDVPPPSGWGRVGDAASAVLPDGRVLIGNPGDPRTAVWDPETGLWTASASRSHRSSEETWTLLADGTVMAPSCENAPATETYVAETDEWVSAGDTPVELVEKGSLEIGPACLLPDGRLFAVGATGHNALYVPSPTAGAAGTWIAGPDFPDDASGRPVGCKDAPACLLPNGNVLCAAGPVGDPAKFLVPTYFHEFDGTNLFRVDDPPTATREPFVGRLLLVPTGEVLFAASRKQVYAYGPPRAPQESWRPSIVSAPVTLRALGIYTLFGRQLNGLSQAVAYGDDAAAATNYPLVRLRRVADGTIHYCRTFDHSTMAVATGAAIHSTQFEVPEDVGFGEFELVVVANGIASEPVRATVRLRPTYVLPFPMEKFVRFVSEAKARAEAIGPRGPIAVKPFGADAARETRRAWTSVASGLRALQAVGARLDVARAKEARRRIAVKEEE